jgi:hypothetical protein
MKAGQTIVWQVDHKSYTAKPGAKAIVKKDLLVTDDYVEVVWIRDELSKGQIDGKYFPNNFKIEENESN